MGFPNMSEGPVKIERNVKNLEWLVTSFLQGWCGHSKSKSEAQVAKLKDKGITHLYIYDTYDEQTGEDGADMLGYPGKLTDAQMQKVFTRKRKWSTNTICEVEL